MVRRNLLRQGRRLLLGRDTGLCQQELVASGPREQIVRSDQGGEARDDLLQKPVADRVAVHVVNILEIIHVQAEQGAVPAGHLLGDDILKAREKFAPIENARQGIMAGR